MSGGYRTILADPPWKYDNKRTGGNLTSGSAQKYSTLTLEQIKAMPIQDFAHPQSCLLLWITAPLLPEGLSVMEAWGYKYKAIVTWEKLGRLGMGFWFRCQTEFCLIGASKGMKPLRIQKKNIFQARPGEHSQKPEEFFGLIEAAAPSPRIELFARIRREGWDSWGDELEGGSDIYIPIPGM